MIGDKKGTIAYIGIGSNQGNKEDSIKKALQMLDVTPDVRVTGVASLYRTEPQGYREQDWFLNTVIRVETALSPHQLLTVLLNIEDRLGRVRTVRWGPRTVDLDLLLYGSEHIETTDLIVPHPRMVERAFVMVPLAELAPDLVLPGQGEAAGLARALVEQQPVEKLKALII